jgi:hypothetical protein
MRVVVAALRKVYRSTKCVFAACEENWAIIVTKGNPITDGEGEAAIQRFPRWCVWVGENSFWGSGSSSFHPIPIMLFDEIHDPREIIWSVVAAMGWVASVADKETFCATNAKTPAYIETVYYSEGDEAPMRTEDAVAAAELSKMYLYEAWGDEVWNIVKHRK